MLQRILKQLPGNHPWREHIYWFDRIGSTNDLARDLAANSVPSGTVVLAGLQTNGHGRMGRSFSSPDGMGVYFSCILRPNCKPEQLMHLTCAAAVGAAQAVEAASGLRPGIKWTNDLVIGRKKLGGILTSLQIDPQTGLVSSAVIGIGINCLQKDADFPPEIRALATSLSMHTERCDPAALAAALILEMQRIEQRLLSEKAQIMASYKDLCITLGREVSWKEGACLHHGKAVDLDADGGLILEFPDGSRRTAAFGEVSIRGMYGYL